MPRAALITLNSSDDPSANLEITRKLVAEAAAKGAQFVLTPEVTNCVSSSRSHQHDVLALEGDDVTLKGLREEAEKHKIFLLIGSIALKTREDSGRFVNRSFLIGPDGAIISRYDKIHMFDVTLSETESYKESSGYRPGATATVAQTPFGAVGMTICYDLRFPYLHRALAQVGAQILTVPAAFAQPTGEAHWEVLLRARAIETGCFVFAPAQTGLHQQVDGTKSRRTFGHSLAISPWGEVLFDGGVEVAVGIVDFDVKDVADARARIPSLKHDREFEVLK